MLFGLTTDRLELLHHLRDEGLTNIEVTHALGISGDQVEQANQILVRKPAERRHEGFAFDLYLHF